MTLNQALSAVKSRPNPGGDGALCFLACGFEPLHLTTLLHASLLERSPGSYIGINSGLYGDLSGNLRLAAESKADATAVLVEWSDIDPRLGLRSSGGWSHDVLSDIAASCVQRLARIETAIGKLAPLMPVAVSPPCLPLPPVGGTIGAQSDTLELELESRLASFLRALANVPGVRILQRSHPALAAIPPADRLDARMELLSGFPYKLPFAGVLAESLATLLFPPAPKKGLITDLDDTLWHGLVGEIGPDSVSWNQEHHSQIHGLYQQMLGHLADCGVLLAVCSKNELSVVETALARKDLLLKSDSLFPVLAGWGPKSQAVARILQTWNIHEDAVVFIDDNPMELEEVRRAFPGITCRQFNAKDAAGVWNLLGELRNLFGKPLITQEDQLRQASIRASARIQEIGGASDSPEFLRGLEGSVTLNWHLDPSDKRALELINKTNQFNLNGIRVAEAEWQRLLSHPDTILGVVSYSDKFGPLGRIGVIAGSRDGASVEVKHWVLSCRAFSRRIEHHTLHGLFHDHGVDEIRFAFQTTERNQPAREFFRSLGIKPDSTGGYVILNNDFFSRGGELPHRTVSQK